jgi:hypothetical protein
MAEASFSKGRFESDEGIHYHRDPGSPRQTGKSRLSAHQWLAWVFLSTVFLIGCDAMPRDSAGALNRVRELRGGPWKSWANVSASIPIDTFGNTFAPIGEPGFPPWAHEAPLHDKQPIYGMSSNSYTGGLLAR